MPYLPHHLLQFGGNLGGGDGDIWTCGIRLKVEGAGGGEELDEDQYLEDTAEPALVTWFMNSITGISLNARLTFAKCNAIGPDGRYSQPNDVHERFWTPVQGGSSGAMHPFQVSLVYTWETNEASRGPGSRGRIYVPGITGAIDGATGRLTPGLAGQYAIQAESLINSLDAGLGPLPVGTVRPCIASKVGDGALNQIDRVSVDDRLDIIRSRANQGPRLRFTEEVDY